MFSWICGRVRPHLANGTGSSFLQKKMQVSISPRAWRTASRQLRTIPPYYICLMNNRSLKMNVEYAGTTQTLALPGLPKKVQYCLRKTVDSHFSKKPRSSDDSGRGHGYDKVPACFLEISLLFHYFVCKIPGKYQQVIRLSLL